MGNNKENTLIVNRLPSPTWNRLGVNRAYVELEKMPETENTVACVEQGVEQVRKETRDSQEAAKWADSLSDGIRRESTIAGKRAIYQEEHFATGLGRDFSELMQNIAPETEVYSIGENQKIEAPIILNWDFGEEGKAGAQQIIHAGKHSEATIILTYKSGKDAKGHAAFETKVIIEEGATLHLVKVNLLGSQFVLLDDSAAVVRDEGTFRFTQLSLGGSQNYLGCYADECGKNSKFIVNTGYMANEDHLIDLNYVAVQRGVKSDSKIYVKGSLRDEARKIFRGTIDFRQGAKGAVGDEQEDVLLLDPQAINKTVPVVLTEEEDVDGRHGATIGNLSEDILFYLGNRGIDKTAAEMLMTQGRLLSVANQIPENQVVADVAAYIREAFENNDGLQ